MLTLKTTDDEGARNEYHLMMEVFWANLGVKISCRYWYMMYDVLTPRFDIFQASDSGARHYHVIINKLLQHLLLIHQTEVTYG